MDKSNKIESKSYQNTINTMKTNIRKLMEKKGITQSALSKATDISQPRISSALSPTTSECFTVEQLARIALFLGASTDELLGINQGSGSPKDRTLADVFSILFCLNDIIPVKFGYCKTGKYVSDEDSFSFEKETQGIYFDNAYVTDFLKEWSELSTANIENIGTKQKILQLWKKETLEAASERKESLNYKTEYEEGERLFNILIEQYRQYKELQYTEYRRSGLSGTWTEEALALITNYVRLAPFLPASATYEEVDYALKLAMEYSTKR